jgi:AraC-like DNA-binding protein
MQMHEHESELGHWRTAQRLAHPRLRAFVRGYLASSSFLPLPVRERHLPSAEIPLVLNFGAPHRRLDPGDQQKPVSYDNAWIVGLHDRHQLTEAVGERDFMVVRLSPLGAHCLLRTPMHLIRGQAVELGALDPKLAALVMTRVGAAGSWGERFAAMEALIAERVEEAAVPSGLALAWRRLEAADGRLPLGPLASEVDCSHRALIAQFRTYVGVTPKTIGRLLRFQRAMRLFKGNCGEDGGPSGKPYIESQAPGDPAAPAAPAVCWSDIAADCGYFDQSHFIKEFRQFTGASPTRFARRMSDFG